MWSGFACLVRRHQWQGTENRETQGWDFHCRRCGRERSTYPGDPAFRPHVRGGHDGGHNVSDNGSDGGFDGG